MSQTIKLNESTVSNRIIYLWSVLSNGTSPAQFETGGQPKMSVGGLPFWSTASTLQSLDTANGEYFVPLQTSDVSVAGPGVVRYSSTSALETSITFQIVAFNPYDAVNLGTSISTFDSSVLSVTVSAMNKTVGATSGLSFAPAPGAYSTVTVGTGSLSSAAGNTAADLLLLRNIAGGASSGRTIGEAFAVLRNKVAIAGSAGTVYQVDDTTSFWTFSTTTVDPTVGTINSVDPG